MTRMVSLRHYWLRLAKVKPTQWPGKIARFVFRLGRELIAEALTRYGLINQVPQNLEDALLRPYREEDVPYILKDALRRCFFIRPEQREGILTALREIAPEAEKPIVACLLYTSPSPRDS